MTFPRYPRYKDSGVGWLGEVPAHWEVKRLRYVALLNPSKSEIRPLPAETPVSFIPMEALGDDGSLVLDQTRALQDVIDGYTYVREGDVVVAKITPCFENGKAAIMRGLTNEVGLGTTELTVLRPRGPVTTSTYLFRVVTSEPFRWLGESHMYGAGGQKRVPDDFLRDFSIAWPPREEQGRIAAFLNHETGKIDALIEEQRRLIELLKEKRQAVISHAVTDHGCKTPGRLGYYIDLLPGYAFPSQGFRFDDGIRLLRGINVGVGEIRWNEAVFWPEESATGLEDYFLREGDVVLGMDRPWIGGGTRVARVSRQDLPALLLQRVARIRAIEGLDPGFLWLILVSQEFKRELETDLTGVSVPHISPEQIRSFRLSLPDLEVQSELGKRVESELKKVGLLIEQCERSIALMEERKTSLVSAAVTGKIDVRGWSVGADSEELELAMVAEEPAGYSAQGGSA